VEVTSLGYIGLETTKLDDWPAFAQDVLGFEASRAGAGGDVLLRMDEHPYRFVLREGGRDALACIGWEVSDGEALQGLMRRLELAGVPVWPASDQELEQRRVRGLLHAAGPAGHHLEFFVGMAPASRPFAPPRGISFRTGDLGLGHLVAHVQDVHGAVAFYTDVLGFRLSDRLDEVLYFLRCNPRHHSIGLAHLSGPPRLLHVMVEADSLDAVGSTLDICLARGIRCSSIGVHTNDRMTSFYLQTPSGFEVEYGWNGLLVDEAKWQTGVIDQPSIWGHHQFDPEHLPGPRPFRRPQKATTT